MSELSKFEITIILPTLNEGENLKILLVDFIDEFIKQELKVMRFDNG